MFTVFGPMAVKGNDLEGKLGGMEEWGVDIFLENAIFIV